MSGPTNVDHIELWDAVNAYAESCGGDTSSATISGRRMDAVVRVSAAVSRLNATATPEEAGERCHCGDPHNAGYVTVCAWCGEPKGGGSTARPGTTRDEPPEAPTVAPPAGSLSVELAGGKLTRDESTPEKAEWWRKVGEAAAGAPTLTVAAPADPGEELRLLRLIERRVRNVLDTWPELAQLDALRSGRKS